ncbi:hypothetical protein AVEN_48116-1 [Araneus ventricosus]|uniref:DUF4371 domain-containing protein n=1 Tax=Araneus ventricosus TaxID=182803 RepID=A0A4Y2L610_ARAVE|nr:hypothetical protein AVEN_48116-1 [Araneus ventricosus]
MEADKEKRKLPGSQYRQVQKKPLLEKSAKNTQNIELFLKKESATVNLSLNVDSVEADSEKETPAVTSKLAPHEEVVDSTAFTTQKSLALIVPESESSSSALKNRDVALFRGTDTVVYDAMKKQGHRDSGILKEDSKENEGNFKAELHFRVEAGDEILKNHLKDHSGNSSYINPETQNSIIEEIGRLLQEKIVKEVAKAEFFSILVDGTTDCSVEEQLGISLRYILDGKLFENFFGFVKITDGTALNIANVILRELEKKGVDKTKMRGQGYDECAAMSCHTRGMHTVIKNTGPTAFYMHCASHTLNLVVNEACEIRAIRNTQGTIKKFVLLLIPPPKECTNYKQALKKRAPNHHTPV